MGKGYLSHNNAHVVYSGTRATVRHARHGEPDPSAVAIVNSRMARGLGKRPRTDAKRPERKSARMHVGWVSVLPPA